MSANNTQQGTTEEAELTREVTIAFAVARKNIPDEAMVQSYLLVRFLSHPETFAVRKRLLERVLRRPIQMQKPFTHAELSEAFKRTDPAGRSATIIEFPTPAKR